MGEGEAGVEVVEIMQEGHKCFCSVCPNDEDVIDVSCDCVRLDGLCE